MKKLFLATIAIILAATTFISCNKSKVVSTFTAVVTAKNINGALVFQVDDDTRVYPTNVQASAYPQETRVLTQLVVDGKVTELQDGQKVEVLMSEDILTKKAEEYVDGKKYGDDPVSISDSWITSAEDGYVTLHIKTYLGDATLPHIVELVTGVNPEDPYELEFCHNANGNISGTMFESMVAFNIRDILPTTPGDVDLTIKYLSFEGPKTLELTATVK